MTLSSNIHGVANNKASKAINYESAYLNVRK